MARSTDPTVLRRTKRRRGTQIWKKFRSLRVWACQCQETFSSSVPLQQHRMVSVRMDLFKGTTGMQSLASTPAIIAAAEVMKHPHESRDRHKRLSGPNSI